MRRWHMSQGSLMQFNTIYTEMHVCVCVCMSVIYKNNTQCIAKKLEFRKVYFYYAIFY